MLNCTLIINYNFKIATIAFGHFCDKFAAELVIDCNVQSLLVAFYVTTIDKRQREAIQSEHLIYFQLKSKLSFFSFALQKLFYVS